MAQEGALKWPLESLKEEFKHLVNSTGIFVEDFVLIRLKSINPALYIGKGKAVDILARIQEKKIN